MNVATDSPCHLWWLRKWNLSTISEGFVWGEVLIECVDYTSTLYGAYGNYFDIFDDYVALSTYWTTTWPC